MRCAPSLQSLKSHLIFFGGMPPRIGRAMCSVAEGGSRSETKAGAGVVDGAPDDGEGEEEEASGEVRCLPACTRRMSVVGAEVRRERSWRRVGIVVSAGTVRGMATRGRLVS